MSRLKEMASSLESNINHLTVKKSSDIKLDEDTNKYIEQLIL